jgi:hypothetical protein
VSTLALERFFRIPGLVAKIQSVLSWFFKWVLLFAGQYGEPGVIHNSAWI